MMNRVWNRDGRGGMNDHLNLIATLHRIRRFLANALNGDIALLNHGFDL
jgi:hypothetical protein